MTPEQILRLTLRQGTVYYMQQRSVTSAKPHYCIVMNASPLTDELIVLSIVTSNVEMRKDRARLTGERPETIVEMGPADYPELSLPSCVDCNDVKRGDASQFRSDVSRAAAVPCRDLPPGVLERIVAGILLSTQVDDRVKDLVRIAV